MAGRGKGRGKSAQQQQQQQQQQTAAAPRSYAQMGGGTTAGPPRSQQSVPPSGSAWGPPPSGARTGPPASGSAWGPPAGGAARATHRSAPSQPGDLAASMAQVNLGASHPPQTDSAAAGGGRPATGNGGNGNGAGAPVGRGAMRGRRQIEPSQILKTRPAGLETKQGAHTQGCTALNLVANYFKINTVPDWALLQYRVDIAPEEDRTRERQYLLRVHRELLGGYLFDGTVLYTTRRITSPQNPTVTLTSDNRDASQRYTITVREVGEVDFGDYAYVQVYNLLLRTCISSLDLQLVGRDYYDARARVGVPQFSLELWPGYKTSIRQHESSILMCVEITHKVMRMETVLDILMKCHNNSSSDYKREFAKEIIGCIVLTKYNNKTYRIDDINWDLNARSTFRYRDQDVSYEAYMLQKYQITIRDGKQPLLVSRAKARDVRAGMSEVVHLIPEVCYCTGLTDFMRANTRLMQELAKHTRVAPDSRINKLRQFNQRLQSNEQAMEQLRRFNMTLDSDLVKFKGRSLPEETMLFGEKCTAPAGHDVSWTKSLRRVPMLHSTPLSNWVIVLQSRAKNDAWAFLGMLQRAGEGMRFRIAEPRMVEVQRDGGADYAQALSKVMEDGQPQLIMCCVPNNRGDRYAAIKKKCCVDRPVPTQVILCKNLNDAKKSMSIATKVAIQINCKVGGAPWSVGIPLTNLMVVGFDVCHDTSNRNMSFGAMVASLDKAVSRYFSAVTPHQSGEELSNNLALNLVRAVKRYAAINGQPPERIVMYRDGVGEGQIPYIHSTELEALKAKLSQVYGEKKYSLVFIIVTKRINTRIFTERAGNPPPATVVDDVITDPEKYDFFLVSQFVSQGTVSPTSYNVIYDTLNLPPQHLQRLTYKLCHLYFNWSGTVRVPAPCQYAHKLAFLVGQALHREPNQAIEDLLYFL